ncbi:3'-5' exonuclease [Xanthomonas campestris]|uniref:3'-5' exonuclease n=1 Tax=Xanthomonas campestris TaxID=339 RepID=UPI002367F4F3|nr:3'-5' exonuclease [Xanthomonas campestris]WDI93184.1 AAA family ATPase [Xanthomonas campestris]
MNSTWWRDIEDLDVDQRRVYALPIDGRYLVIGPPGSGKTNALLLRAVYLRKSGNSNICVITFGRTLAEFVKSGAAQNGKLPANQLFTFAEWANTLHWRLTGDSISLANSQDHDSSRRERINALRAAIVDGSLDNSYFDCILIDEVQDFWRDEIEILSMLSRNLFFCGDSRQRIFGRNEGIPAALEFGCEERRLSFHYRIGQEICKVADRVLPNSDKLMDRCQYKERILPSTARLHKLETDQKQFSLLLAGLTTQLRAFPDELIGVIVYKNETAKRLYKALSKTVLQGRCGLHSQQERSFDYEKPITIITAHSAKGTEFRAVHIFKFEEFMPWYTRELAFTAITRAKTSLDVYASGEIDGSLEAAFQEMRLPSPEEVF